MMIISLYRVTMIRLNHSLISGIFNDSRPPIFTYESIRELIGEKPISAGRGKIGGRAGKGFTHQKDFFNLIFRQIDPDGKPFDIEQTCNQGWQSKSFIQCLFHIKELLEPKGLYIEFIDECRRLFNLYFPCLTAVARNRFIQPKRMSDNTYKPAFVAFDVDGWRIDGHEPGSSWKIERKISENVSFGMTIAEALDPKIIDTICTRQVRETAKEYYYYTTSSQRRRFENRAQDSKINLSSSSANAHDVRISIRNRVQNQLEINKTSSSKARNENIDIYRKRKMGEVSEFDAESWMRNPSKKGRVVYSLVSSEDEEDGLEEDWMSEKDQAEWEMNRMADVELVVKESGVRIKPRMVLNPVLDTIIDWGRFAAHWRRFKR